MVCLHIHCQAHSFSVEIFLNITCVCEKERESVCEREGKMKVSFTCGNFFFNVQSLNLYYTSRCLLQKAGLFCFIFGG